MPPRVPLHLYHGNASQSDYIYPERVEAEDEDDEDVVAYIKATTDIDLATMKALESAVRKTHKLIDIVKNGDTVTINLDKESGPLTRVMLRRMSATLYRFRTRSEDKWEKDPDHESCWRSTASRIPTVVEKRPIRFGSFFDVDKIVINHPRYP